LNQTRSEWNSDYSDRLLGYELATAEQGYQIVEWSDQDVSLSVALEQRLSRQTFVLPVALASLLLSPRSRACIFIEEELPDNRRVVRSSFEGSGMLTIISWRRSLGLVLQVFCEA
jgi:hypothetical protein